MLLYLLLHTLFRRRKQNKLLTGALKIDLDGKTALLLRAREKLYGHVLDRSPAKQMQEDIAHHIFYRKFSILDFMRDNFREPGVTLHMNLKNTHSPSLSSVDLPFRLVSISKVKYTKKRSVIPWFW